MESYICIAVLVVILVGREVQNHFLVKDLHNRLMARDYVQYHQVERSRGRKQIPRIPVPTDEEMAKSEKDQMAQVNKINEEIEERLAAVSKGHSKVGVS